MADLATYIALLPQILKEKYASAFWIAKANEILEILSSEGILRELKYRRGVIVKYKKWITPPSFYRQAIRLTDSLDDQVEYDFEEVNEKIRLKDALIDEDGDPYSVTAFSASATDSIEVDITDLDEDDLKGYLLVITAGTGTNNTYIIAGNDASGVSTTKIYYEVPLSSALGGAEATAGSIIHPEYYLALTFRGSFIDISATSDEIPIKNNHEKRIMKFGLLALGYEQLHYGRGEIYEMWQKKFDDVIMKVRGEFLQVTGKARSRRFIGMLDDDELSENLGESDE